MRKTRPLEERFWEKVNKYRFKRCEKECPEDVERLKEWFQ